MKSSFSAVLFALLLLVSACAAAEIDLTPYELPSEYGSSVQVISPTLTLVLTDKTYGSSNENTLPTSITLYDKGKVGLQIELPDYAEDGTRQIYELFAASPTRYGLITFQPNTETVRPVRFQLLLGNGLTKGVTLNSGTGYYRFTSDSILNRRYEGDTQFIDRYYLEGDLISSTSLPLALSAPYAYTVWPNSTLAYVPDCEDGLHVQRLSSDGTLLSDLLLPHSTDAIIPRVYFSDEGNVLCQYQVGDPYQSSVLNCVDEQNALLWSKTLSAPNAIVAVSQVQFLPDHETVLMGSAVAKSRGLFTIFKLHVDAQGNILSRDIRDFTTHATYRYDEVLDTLGNLYAVTRDTDDYPIAVVPFEDLPAHDDPGLMLE